MIPGDRFRSQTGHLSYLDNSINQRMLLCTRTKSHHHSRPALDSVIRPFAFLSGLHQSATTVELLLYIEQRLKFGDQYPLLITNIRSVEFFQCVDTLPRNHRVKRVLFFQVSAVHWLVWTFNLYCNGGLTFFAYRNLFVVAFDR